MTEKMAPLFCIPKKGKLTDCDNWKEVTLLSVPGKVYCQMILNQMCEAVDSQICKEQAGLRLKLSCAKQIFTLNCIIGKYQEYQTFLAIWIIDFSKAIDCIHRSTLLKILTLYRVSDELMQQKVKNIKEFTYLGSSIQLLGDMDCELHCSIGKASVAFGQLGRIWKNKKFSLRLKLHFYQINVLLTLLYRCKTWYLKVRWEKCLTALDLKGLCRLLRIKWNDFVPNKGQKKDKTPTSLLSHL